MKELLCQYGKLVIAGIVVLTSLVALQKMPMQKIWESYNSRQSTKGWTYAASLKESEVTTASFTVDTCYLECGVWTSLSDLITVDNREIVEISLIPLGDENSYETGNVREVNLCKEGRGVRKNEQGSIEIIVEDPGAFLCTLLTSFENSSSGEQRLFQLVLIANRNCNADRKEEVK